MATVRYTNIEGQIVAEKRSGVRLSYVPDTIGSTAAAVDVNGYVVADFRYWPYGADVTQATLPFVFRFVGVAGYRRDSSRLTYVRARYLATGSSRWLTADPIVPFGAESYAYAGLSPTKNIDPSGLLHCIFNAPGGLGVLNCYSEAGECFGTGSARLAGPPYCPPRGTRMLSCTAGNFVTNPQGDPRTPESNGPIPTGDWGVGDPNPHPGDETGPYGPYFIPVDIPANIRTGIGIHGGRNGPRSQTLGCIRLSNDCLRALVRLLRRRFVRRRVTDPGVTLTVQ